MGYFAYDVVKNIEYKDDTEEGVVLINRLLITLLFLAFFIIASYIFYLFTTDNVTPIFNVEDSDNWKIEFLLILSVLMGVYRYKKRRIKSELRFTT